MLAQDFRCKVRIEKPPLTDDFGIFGLLQRWELVSTVWAAVDPTLQASARLGGMEIPNGRQIQSIATHLITIRYRAIQPEWRFIWKQRVLEIISITNVEEKDRYLRILVKEATERIGV